VEDEERGRGTEAERKRGKLVWAIEQKKRKTRTFLVSGDIHPLHATKEAIGYSILLKHHTALRHPLWPPQLHICPSAQQHPAASEVISTFV
jgi:hypothetical protein